MDVFYFFELIIEQKKGEIQMGKDTTQQIRLVIDYWQAHGDSWADIAVHALSIMAGYAADLPLIDIRPITEFLASHGETAYDRIDPKSSDIPYMQQQIKLLRDMDAAMQCPCDDAAKKLTTGDTTVRDICQLINRAWHVCDQRAVRHTYRSIYSLCMALIRTTKCWPQPPAKNEKEEIVRILKTAITDAENQTSGRYYADDIVF